MDMTTVICSSQTSYSYISFLFHGVDQIASFSWKTIGKLTEDCFHDETTTVTFILQIIFLLMDVLKWKRVHKTKN